MHDPVYMKCPKRQIHRGRKQTSSFRDWGRGDREGLLMGTGFPFGVMKAIYN